MNPASLCHLYLDRVDRTPFATAYLEPHGTGFRSRSWSSVHQEVRRTSAGLRTLGVSEGGGILAETGVPWLIADFALWMARMVSTTLYPSSTAETIRFILDDAGTGVLFVENAAQLEKILCSWPTGLAHVVLMEGEHTDARVLSWTELAVRGDAWLERHGAQLWRDEALEAGADDLATLLYTSGTTADPKGVPLTHGNWLAQAAASDELMGRFGHPGDTLYLWLPLAHAYGKVLQLAGLATGVRTVVNGDHRQISAVLRATSPSWVPAVPRVFEKMRNRMLQQADERGPRAGQVVRWALDVAVLVGAGEQSRRLRLQHALADRLVYRKIREAMGGQIRAFLCGSAPLSTDLEHLFAGLGMPILQGYGLTECAAVATVNLPNATTIGTVGAPAAGTEIRVVDGEVQLRGPGVMAGYHNAPKASAAAFDGTWFRTGDQGSFDGGVLRITGRLKEILITSGGKNIAPAPIESAVKARCGLLQEVVLVGDGRPTLMALVTLDEDAGVQPNDPDVKQAIEAAVQATNATLASYQTIKGFAVLPAPFSIQNGELTASQKVRRSVITERYADVIEAMYR